MELIGIGWQELLIIGLILFMNIAFILGIVWLVKKLSNKT